MQLSQSCLIFISQLLNEKDLLLREKTFFSLKSSALDTNNSYFKALPIKVFLLKVQQNLPDLLFSLSGISSSINPVGT